MSTSLSQLLEELGEDSHSRGRAFERLCRWYLQNDPVYGARLKTVWLWNDWPGRWGADAGIDLVAEEHEGKLWAIQAKAYDHSHSITKRDVDTFLSESARPEFSYRLLIATTNQIGKTALRTLESQEKPAGLRLLADLDRAEVQWPSSIDDLRPLRPSAKSPLPHQAEAIDAVYAGFGETDRGQLIMACGTGKTLVALWAKERLEAQKTLVLLPSLSLLDQTLREWLSNASESFGFLAVCSDETVVGEDHMVSRTAELGLPVTTDPADIAGFLDKRGPSVVFATYQSSPRVAESMTRCDMQFDLTVADEAHRVAGHVGTEFATVLDAVRIRSRRRLFMTATPRYFTGRVRTVARRFDLEMASMDDAAHFGTVLHQLTFGEAIKRDLLSDYQVAVVVVDDPTYREYTARRQLVRREECGTEDARTLAAQVGLAKAMRDYDLHRIISFHGRVKGAQAFAETFPEVASWMSEQERLPGLVRADYVSGEMPSGKRESKLRRLRNLEPGEHFLLSNARCLSEGVDVPALDGVSFVDPRRSTIDIAQAVGRAIRKSHDKSVGTIVLPVFIDSSGDTSEALDSSAFKPVWGVLQALRSHDETLAAELDAVRRELGRGAGGEFRLPERVVLDVPVSVGAEFVEALKVRLVEQTTSSWELWFGLLLAFVDREGHARVPQEQREGAFRLGKWVNQQRVSYSRERLSPDRVARLEALPSWSWRPSADDWEAAFSLLEQYTKREGHARVPHSQWEESFWLGQWLRIQRRAYGKAQLASQQIARLEVLPGWSWDPYADDWEEGLQVLRAFVNREGHARVPQEQREGAFRLGKWVNKQRDSYAKARLSPDRIARLEELPRWSWNTQVDDWEKGFRTLETYVAREGHARVARSHREDGFSLGQWVRAQRRSFGVDNLAPECQTRLEAMPGWTWDPSADDWEKGFRALEAYVAREGHARVARSHREDGFSLGQWVSVQRAAQSKAGLESERVARLQAMPGWTWDPSADDWEKGFRALETYVAREGHARVPDRHREGGFRLGQWVSVQRAAHRKGRLVSQRLTRLEALSGWTWNPYADDWEEGFRLLLNYVGREGHARVPQGHRESDFGLGRWVSAQRTSWRKGQMSSEREARLSSITGWTWSAGGPGH